ncbi:MAG: GTP cyclohydrolase II RibA [Granulosicoccus sp.]
MNATSTPALNGPVDLMIERCVTELQRGREITLLDEHDHRCLRLVEAMDQQTLAKALAGNSGVLVLSRSRARAMRLLSDNEQICLQLPADFSLSDLRALSGLEGVAEHSKIPESDANATKRAVTAPADLHALVTESKNLYAQCALKLARLAHVLPAVVIYRPESLPAQNLFTSVQNVLDYTDQSGKLLFLGSASLPLATAANVELSVFRGKHDGAEHIAILVENPDLSDVVTVRLHSSCFTGDILGSLRCDCGEQLSGAITRMANEGGGVILYLSQEGRGIGLASKLRAYQLQDSGLDTIEANQYLGFDADERSYDAAISMLQHLGISCLKLMTNNPEKISALRDAGLTVIERLPSPATVNVHNARYLETKRRKAGHLAVTD